MLVDEQGAADKVAVVGEGGGPCPPPSNRVGGGGLVIHHNRQVCSHHLGPAIL